MAAIPADPLRKAPSAPQCQRRTTLRKRRNQKLSSVTAKYKEAMAELYHLGSCPGQPQNLVLEFPTFKNKPTQNFINFLKSNHAPDKILTEVRKAAGIKEQTNTNVDSLSMVNHNAQKALTAPSTPLQRMKQEPMSPSKLLDDLPARKVVRPPIVRQPIVPALPSRPPAPPQRQWSSSSSVSTAVKEALAGKMRQEAYVVRRVSELTREGTWSAKKMPKVCERPRPKTTWDGLLSEMQWMAVDFYQERNWKKSAARMLAYSAKAFVATWAETRARAEAERVIAARKRAGFVADKVRNFWAVVEKKKSKLKSEELAQLATKASTASHRPPVLENGVAAFDDDNESTISEQERFETQERTNSSAVIKEDAELADLRTDSQVPVEDLLPEDYLLVLACEKQEHDSGLVNDVNKDDEDMEESDDEDDVSSLDSDDYSDAESVSSSLASYPGGDLVGDMESLPQESLARLLSRLPRQSATARLEERVRRVPMRARQKKLYDDYLAEPETRSAMEKGDVRDIAAILAHLRKICNHPRLVEDQDHLCFSRRFPRVSDIHVPSRVANALAYDPHSSIDLNSLNLVYRTHDFELTAISSDRRCRLCASSELILGPAGPAQPRVPEARVKLDIQATPSVPTNPGVIGAPRTLSRSLSITSQVLPLAPNNTTSKNASRSKQKPSQAFHTESLRTIARFNERRCRAMPLYGQDLILALSIVNAASAPVTSKPFKGGGFVSCLSDQPVSYKLKTAALATAVRTSRSYLRAHEDMHVRLLQAAVPVCLTAGWSVSVKRLQQNVEPTLRDLATKYKLPLKRSLSLQVQPDLEYGRFDHTSAKLVELEKLLKEIRARREKVVIFCEMDDLLYLVRQFLHRKHYPFVYLGTADDEPAVSSKTARLRALARFAKRGDHVSLLASARARPSSRLCALLSPEAVKNVVFVDSSAAGASVETPEGRRWCRALARAARTKITIHRLVCTDSLEDNISRPGLQQKVLAEMREPANNSLALRTEVEAESPRRIKRKTLEDLFGFKFGDNGILANEDEPRPLSSSSDHLHLPPNSSSSSSILNWLWTNHGGDPREFLRDQEDDTTGSEFGEEMRMVAYSGSEGSSEENDDLDFVMPIANSLKEIDEKQLKPLEKYGLRHLLASNTTADDNSLSPEDLLFPDALLDGEPNDAASSSKLAWELSFQNALTDLAAELDFLESLPCLTYSNEDSTRSWHGRDGQPMPLWTPMQQQSGEGDLAEHYLSFLYKGELMEESELPPIYIKKELPTLPQPPTMTTLLAATGAQKRTAAEAGMASLEPTPPGLLPSGSIQAAVQAGLSNAIAGSPFNDIKPNKLRREDTVPMAPRSLFDRPTPQLAKLRRDKKAIRTGPVLPGSVPGQPSLNPTAPVAGLRHPLPRPVVDAENAPEWLIQEDWALLQAVRELLDLPLNLMVLSPAHTPNWDLVSDMVNAVSRVYRAPKQCKARYETIIVAREEGRIHYDPMPPLPQTPTGMPPGTPPNSKKNSKKNAKGGLKNLGPNKGNCAQKTSQLFTQDNNSTWSTLFASRFESIKTVANNRTPTMKPKLPRSMDDARMQKNAKHAAVLAESGISYDVPLNPIKVALNRSERIMKEKERNAQNQQQLAQQQAQQQRAAQNAAQQAQQAAAATAAAQRNAVAQQAAAPVATGQIATQQQVQTAPAIVPGGVAVSTAQQAQAVVVGISQPNAAAVAAAAAAANGRAPPQVIVQGSPISRLQLAQPQQQPQHVTVSMPIVTQIQQPPTSTMVVSSQQPTAVVSVASLTPSQLQSIKNQAALVSAAGKRLTPEQINILRQQALLKKNAQQDPAYKAAVAAGTAGRTIAAGGLQAGQATVVGATTSSGQKVSLAVTPGTSLGTIAVSSGMNAVTVVTQAMTTMAGQQPKALIRQLTGQKGQPNVRSLNENEMRVLLASSKQGLAAAGANKGQISSIAIQGQTGITTAQLLQHARVQLQPSSSVSGTPIATIVKTVPANSAAGIVGDQQQQQQPGVAIPVNSMPPAMVRAIRGQVTAANPQQMQLIQKQLMQQQQQRAKHPGGIAAGTIVTAAGGQQKVTFSQVQGGKGVPAQLIVSSGAGGQKHLQQGVTVQQIQQLVKQVQPGGNLQLAQQLGNAQNLIPHAVLAKQGQGLAGQTVQARVIPVSSAGGRPGQIQVVAASPGNNPAVMAALAGRTPVAGQQGRVAPNVTIDASGLPATVTSSQLANVLAGGSHIKVAVTTAGGSTPGHQQLFTTTYGQPVSVALRSPIVSSQHGQQHIMTAAGQKLQVVTTASGQQILQAATVVSTAQHPQQQQQMQQQQQQQQQQPGSSKDGQK